MPLHSFNLDSNNSISNTSEIVKTDDVKYSDRYSELWDMNARINELRKQRKAIIASEEYNKVVKETMKSDDADKAMKTFLKVMF